MRLKQQNARFLGAITQIRPGWEKDKEVTKIVKKMEKGKNLKRNEFAKIHWALWEKGHLNSY